LNQQQIINFKSDFQQLQQSDGLDAPPRAKTPTERALVPAADPSITHIAAD